LKTKAWLLKKNIFLVYARRFSFLVLYEKREVKEDEVEEKLTEESIQSHRIGMFSFFISFFFASDEFIDNKISLLITS
jgi:hypothetical protein